MSIVEMPGVVPDVVTYGGPLPPGDADLVPVNTIPEDGPERPGRADGLVVAILNDAPLVEGDGEVIPMRKNVSWCTPTPDTDKGAKAIERKEEDEDDERQEDSRTALLVLGQWEYVLLDQCSSRVFEECGFHEPRRYGMLCGSQPVANATNVGVHVLRSGSYFLLGRHGKEDIMGSYQPPHEERKSAWRQRASRTLRTPERREQPELSLEPNGGQK